MRQSASQQDISVSDAELGDDFAAVRRVRLMRDARLTPAERLLKLDALLRGAAAIRTAAR